ncbi:hypothetical protein [Novipirellula sp.]|uniref:hypothetical protein n=1 Tax=Novipirellula sp. TaxID=2795430 RepID=UPI0035626FC0
MSEDKRPIRERVIIEGGYNGGPVPVEIPSRTIIERSMNGNPPVQTQCVVQQSQDRPTSPPPPKEG